MFCFLWHVMCLLGCLLPQEIQAVAWIPTVRDALAHYYR